MTRKFAKVTGALPGPKSKALLERRQAAVVRGVSNGVPSFAAKAEGALITDVDGNTFIDFVGAIGTMNVGHCHPKVKEAIHKQVDEYIHPGFNVMMYEPYIELCEKLIDLAPGDHEKQAILFNSGAEAVENAVKVARKYTKRTGVISFSRAYHGRTLLTMTMTSKVKPYKYEFGPFAPEVYKAPFPYTYRRPEGTTEEQYVDSVISQFEDFFVNDVAPESVAAVIMEPVQGEGGFIPAPQKFIEAVYAICKKHGILFIADEIQTGFGRTGKQFAIEHFGIVPDLMTVSKSMAAGVPISGLIGRKEVMEAAAPGELGGTYSGSPLGCAAALAVIDIMEEEKINERGAVLGQLVMDRLSQLAEKYEAIGEIRGLGSMVAVELVKDRTTKEPNKELTNAIIAEANNRGLLIISAGAYGNVLRFLMPLVITDEQVAEGLEILEEAFEVAVSAVTVQA
ncbi:4-aminobutyrate--2-oxoglutarate transaminase [Bacillus sp. FJAT-42315]|uniref:4-aminobutyrate--2-oxoglutarate transaminase n=1 Tax=Bacillus sp. FJAT-42315 TaxID=2014077 RepID=UPI003FA42766